MSSPRKDTENPQLTVEEQEDFFNFQNSPPPQDQEEFDGPLAHDQEGDQDVHGDTESQPRSPRASSELNDVDEPVQPVESLEEGDEGGHEVGEDNEAKLKRTRDLEAEIFGDSESDMSEMEEMGMSSDEEDVPRRARPSRRSPSHDRDVRYDESGYQISSKKHKSGKEKQTRKAGRKTEQSREATATTIPLEEMNPRQRAEAVVAQDFKDALAAMSNNSRRRKTERMDEADIDEIMIRLREKMKAAAYSDQESNERKQPAMAKIRMLPSVITHLQKVSLYDQFIDNNILEAIKVWLEPLPDGSVPSLDILIALIEILDKMPISTDNLRESGIGRVIKFYTLVPVERITEKLRRAADRLIRKWTRPIIQRSSNYRDKSFRRAEQEPEEDDGLEDERSSGKRARLSGNVPRTGPAASVDVLGDLGRVQKDGEPKKGQPGYWSARIPVAAAPNYDVAPRPNISEASAGYNKTMGARNKKLKSRMAQIKKNHSRGSTGVKFSVEGKGLHY